MLPVPAEPIVSLPGACRPKAIDLVGLEQGIADSDVVLDTRYAYPAYGLPSAETNEAIRTCARLEGMMTDPVYEGKSMQGMMDIIRRGEIPEGSKVLYAHLGGVPAIDQGFAGVATSTLCFSEVLAELLFQHAVHALELLLFAQLLAVVGSAGTRSAAVLARLGIQLALGIQRATGALQEQVSTLATRELAFGSNITCHVDSL